MKPQRGGEQEPTVWGEKQKNTFKNIKRARTNAPALGLPDMIIPFFLYVHERLGAVGILTQHIVSWHCLVVYLSKQLDAVSPGWPPSLNTLAATAVLVAKADKLTLREKLSLSSPLCFDSHGI
jgi:hypothetical protein